MEGRKRSIHWWRGYLSVVSEESQDKALLTVLDVQNKFIGFSAPVRPVLGVLAEWGSILLVTQVLIFHNTGYLHVGSLFRRERCTN